MIIPVVLAGGSGTRLWPMSRQLYPKQMLKLVNEYTMLQNTMLRLEGAGEAASPMIICNEKHRWLLEKQLDESGITPSAVILEPVGKNTAPAVAAAALKALSIDKSCLILVLPADHLINNRQKFHEAVRSASVYADRGFLVTFGVVPDRPETGYGYIRKGEAVPPGEGQGAGTAGFAIDKFVEKPDHETARQYVDSGLYCWNSGMFMFGASSVLEEIRRFAPKIAESADSALQRAAPVKGALRLDEKSFSGCPSDSIDYAVMEKTDKGVMIPFDAGWDDLGSWASIWSVAEKDASGNCISGDVRTAEVGNSLLFSTSRLVAGAGLSGHVVVETADAVLVASMEKAQAVKDIAEELKKSGRREAVSHLRVYTAWGFVETLSEGSGECIRRLFIGPGGRISFSGHCHGALSWIVRSGKGLFSGKQGEKEIGRQELVCIGGGEDVSLSQAGDDPLVVLEIIDKMDKGADHLA